MQPGMADDALLQTIHTQEYLHKLATSRVKVAWVLELPPVAFLPMFLINRLVMQPMRHHVAGTVMVGLNAGVLCMVKRAEMCTRSQRVMCSVFGCCVYCCAHICSIVCVVSVHWYVIVLSACIVKCMLFTSCDNLLCTQAAAAAVQHGWSINLGGGMHHAAPDVRLVFTLCGSGFVLHVRAHTHACMHQHCTRSNTCIHTIENNTH